jgi:hypothetical protein
MRPRKLFRSHGKMPVRLGLQERIRISQSDLLAIGHG